MIQELESTVDYSKCLHYGKFYCDGFSRGEAQTLANSLRRTLIYSLEGKGISHIRFRYPVSESKSIFDQFSSQELAIHEFSSLPGMRESIQEFLFNLRGIVWFSNQIQPKDTNRLSEKKTSPELHSTEIPKDEKSNKKKAGSSLVLDGLEIQTFSWFDICKKKETLNVQASKSTDLFILRAGDLGGDKVANPDHYLATFSLSRCQPFLIDCLFTDSKSQSDLNPLRRSNKLTEISFSTQEISKEKIFGETSNIEFRQSFDSLSEYSDSASDKAYAKDDFDFVLNSLNPWIPTSGQFFPVQRVNYNIIQQSGETFQSASAKFSQSNGRPLTDSKIGAFEPNFRPSNFSSHPIAQAREPSHSRLLLKEKSNRRVNEEAIILEIWTNRSISPHFAFQNAIHHCIGMFNNLLY
jgi:RNA polymerase Rpb3/Rpb11 dimerisation domain